MMALAQESEGECACLWKKLRFPQAEFSGVAFSVETLQGRRASRGADASCERGQGRRAGGADASCRRGTGDPDLEQSQAPR